jgi:hypothetical protein
MYLALICRSRRAMSTCQAVSAVLSPTVHSGFYFSGAHIFRKKNYVQVNLEPPLYEPDEDDIGTATNTTPVPLN